MGQIHSFLTSHRMFNKSMRRAAIAAKKSTACANVADDSSSVASSLPAARVSEGARGIVTRANDVSDVELVYSVVSDGGSDSVIVATPPGSPVAATTEPSTEKARSSKMTHELRHSLFGSDDESDYSSPTPASANSQSCDHDDGSRRRETEVRGPTPSVGTTQ